MVGVRKDHFQRAAADVGARGDNDTLPFDSDTAFVKANQDSLADLAFDYAQVVQALENRAAAEAVDDLQVFSERLLAPTGSAGFRITTKIHPFWNLYFNGLGVSIAEILEPMRSDRAHSYRFVTSGNRLFAPSASWRAFLEATIADCESHGDDAIVVQTDISSFYEHIYHHRLENRLDELFEHQSTIPTQIDRFLNKFAAGRSFGLPVGGQCSRILAEVLLSSIDARLEDERLKWRRYVDDFVLITASQSEAYGALATLAHALADYGLTLNRTKTTLLSAKHYVDYVKTQLRGITNDSAKLLEIDLKFDPYSNTADADYEELRHVVEGIDIQSLLNHELGKSQPDTFLVTQVARTLRFNKPEVSMQLCSTLLSARNLHAFRASWSTIMSGVAKLRADERFKVVFDHLDSLLDAILAHSPHLLRAEASCLHYLRALRLRRTQPRAEFVLSLHSLTKSETVKRACIDCWRNWRDGHSFTREVNRWNALGPEQKRMLWLAAADFDDEGSHFRKRVKANLRTSLDLGIEHDQNSPTFASIYMGWANNGN